MSQFMDGNGYGGCGKKAAHVHQAQDRQNDQEAGADLNPAFR
jgi:hypothetical protein